MLYLDCSSGVSGDMLVGALIDLGADFDLIQNRLSHLADISIKRIKKRGVDSVKFNVVFNSNSKTYPELISELTKLKVSERVRDLANAILHTLALAESRVHKTNLEGVNLHEARDSLVDSVAVAIALESLDLLDTKISSSLVSVGRIAPATREIIHSHMIPVKEITRDEIATPTGMAILARIVDEFQTLPKIDGSRGHGAGEMDLHWPNVVAATWNKI